MEILIVKLGALGDVVNTLPLVINLKRHLGARIHWLVEPLSYPIISGHPYVDRAILFEKQRWSNSLVDVGRQIRAQTFDITIDLQRILKSGILCMLARTRRRIGFDRKRCKEMTWMLPFTRIPESDPKSHMVYQYLEFAAHLGIPNGDVRWELPLSGKLAFELPEDYVVLNIGATKPANRWTPKGFASLAHAIHQSYGLASVITGGREDTGMAKKITAISGREVVDIVGRTSVTDLMEVLANAKAVVSCDTGAMHLAVALNKKVVALFGPSDPRRTGPLKGKVIRKPLDCSPCNLRECKDPVCMRAITHEDVFESLEGSL
jgi:heptosyltransferase-1